MPIKASCDICKNTFTDEDLHMLMSATIAGEVYCAKCQEKIDLKYAEQIQAIDRAAIIEAEKKTTITER